MKQEKIRVLYVDDEVNNLISFKAGFRKFFDVYTAESAEEGQEVLKSRNIHVIITDQQMPGTTGVEFLEWVITEHPEVVRLFLTGYDDIHAAVNAINKGQVFRYINKPWKEDELKAIIEKAFDVYKHKEERSKEANTFVYKVSHDLKAPLASLGGLVSIAKEENNDSNTKHYIDLIGNRVEHLDDILNELLDYVTIGQKELAYTYINFETLVDEILSYLVNVDEFKGIEFKTNILQQTEFKSDKGIMRSVLQNLIVNSLKYRRLDIKNPYVSINIAVSPREARIAIEDNGKGISEGALSKIFNMFFRENTNIKGSGLGLYIVKTSLEKIGGTINVNSIVNKGSAFTLEVPNKIAVGKRLKKELN